MIIFLYVTTVLIWGTTWLAIYWQLGDIPILVSVFYRFALATILLLPAILFFSSAQIPKLKQHGYLILFGACLFSLNFICFYNATLYIPSGLASVIFALATLYNVINSRIFFKEPISRHIIIASLTGITGLSLLFWSELKTQVNPQELILGISLAALGTLFFSFGNMISRRNSQAGIKPIVASAWGMLYGTIILLIIITLTQTELVIPDTQQYVFSLIYLSIFGSIIAFTTYLSLVEKIGANRSAYATVLFPIIALILSSIFEGYVWNSFSYIGLILTLGGVALINYKPNKAGLINTAKD